MAHPSARGSKSRNKLSVGNFLLRHKDGDGATRRAKVNEPDHGGQSKQKLPFMCAAAKEPQMKQITAIDSNALLKSNMGCI